MIATLYSTSPQTGCIVITSTTAGTTPIGWATDFGTPTDYRDDALWWMDELRPLPPAHWRWYNILRPLIDPPLPRGVHVRKPRRRDHMHDHCQRLRHKRRAFVQALRSKT